MKLMIFLLLSCLTFSSLAAVKPSKKLMAEAFVAYKKGAYLDTLEILDNSKLTNDPLSAYLKGITHSRMQNFDQAIANFEKALTTKKQPEDLYYEYGQALFALKEYKKGQKVFALSIKNNFRIDQSLYYIGYMSSELKEYERAKKYYKQINKRKNVDEGILQAANYQLGDIILKQALQNPDPAVGVKKYVIPQLEIAYNINTDSPLGKEILNKINTVKNKYHVGKDVMINGRKIPKKRHKVRFYQEFNYDDNVVLQAEEAQDQATNTDSLFYLTQVKVSYIRPIKKRFTTTPELSIFNTSYAKDNNPEIAENNSYSIVPAINSTYEHTFKGKRAATKLDIQYNYTARDVNQNDELVFHSRFLQIGAGELFHPFDVGSTTIMLYHKSLKSYDPNNNTDSVIFNTIQNFKFPNNHLLTTSVLFTFNSVVDDSTSTTDYTLQSNYYLPPTWGGIKTQLGLSLTVTDTKEQSATRGTELLYNPRLYLRKNFAGWFETAFGYNYNKKSSDDETTYAYSSHAVTLSVDINI